MTPELTALHIANAVMFRRLLHILVSNSGETKEARAAVQKQLFEQIMADLNRSQGSPEIKKAAEQIVMGIFGIPSTGRPQH